ncbi:hypothetical protein EAE99_011200 [Botrytis elliptica]|nr:hypothetical protein EAE99_011200 [Botrytis elliptica]
MSAQAVDQATSVTVESKKAAIEQLNKEGNFLFGCKELSEALDKYMEAVEIDPVSPLTSKPLRNTTVVQFECGRYTECIKGIKDILELMVVQPLDDKIVISNLQRLLKRAYDHVPTSSLQEKLQRRLKIFACLPRDRASMFTSPEYFRIGNDVAEPLSVEVPKDSLKKGDIISFFFAGIGDARHLYATIIDLHESGNKTTATPRKYHFVANDLNMCSLTRNLIIWTLLDELSALDHGSDQGLMVLTTIFFIYRPIIMPGYVYKFLCATMEAILAKLDKYDIPRYIDVLKHWASNGFGIFTTEKVIQGTRDKLSQKSLLHDYRDTSKVCTEEKEFYAKYALVYPPEKMILSQEPRLKKLITKALKEKRYSNKLRKYLAKNWKFNPTMMDQNWYRNTLRKYGHSKGYSFEINPFSAIWHFQDTWKGTEPSSLFDHVAPTFKRAANAIKEMKGIFCVEALCGDVTEIAEWFHFDCSPTRVSRSPEFPKSFDCIHMSNIPDYIGGHLSTFLYVFPLLKIGTSSYLKSNCLRNPGSWDCLEAFLADYQCITDKEMLRKLTGVIAALEPGKDELLPLIKYNSYSREALDSQDAWSALLPQAEFQKWFYTLFFRIALPHNVDISKTDAIILSPLNLTVLFRLIDQLHNHGYPSHWMSEIIYNIIENKVASTCRPPRATPTTVSALMRQYKLKKLCTGPFADEIATLTRIFSPILPFVLESQKIPSQEDIHKYTFPLEKMYTVQEMPNNLTLLFWSDKLFREVGQVGFCAMYQNIRPLLDPTWGDEMDAQFKGIQFKTFREKGMVLWSTIEWNLETSEASAWMPSSLMDRMIRERDWGCGLFRTDTWERCWDKLSLVSNARKGEKWEDDITSVEDIKLAQSIKKGVNLEK